MVFIDCPMDLGERGYVMTPVVFQHYDKLLKRGFTIRAGWNSVKGGHFTVVDKKTQQRETLRFVHTRLILDNPNSDAVEILPAFTVCPKQYHSLTEPIPDEAWRDEYADNTRDVTQELLREIGESAGTDTVRNKVQYKTINT
jgi:hypothetical protein